MKARTNDFKNLISSIKETKIKITYGSIELSDEQLNSVQPHYQGSLLKSIMKELDLDSNVEIPNETIINYQFGVKVREASGNDDGYDYINYGNYIVFSSEKQEDTNSYLIKCYDKMLYSMKDYEKLQYRNLLDISQAEIGKGWNNNAQTQRATILYIPIKRGQKYTLTSTWTNSNITQVRGVLNNGASDTTNNLIVTGTFTVPSNQWSYISVEILASTTFTSSMLDGVNIMLCDGTNTDYEPFGDIQYPITIRKYIDLLCNKIGLTFKNANDYFTNYDKTIENELYLDKNGNSLGYKFRDVLDELAQVTGSIICINEDDDELEIRYPSDAGATRTSVSGKDLTLANVDDIKVDDITLTGETTQASTPTPSSPQEIVNVTGRQEIRTCGKNLFNKDTTNFNKGNYLDQNCNITSGSNWGIYYIPVISNTAYTISGCTANTGVYFWWLDSNKNSISLIGSKKNYTNITSPSNAKYIGLSIVWNTTSSAYDGTTFMLEQNSSATTYEPYKEQVNEINLGKNLFDNTLINGTSAWQASYSVTNEIITITSTASSGVSFCNLQPFLYLEPNTTYSLSFDCVGDLNRVRIYDVDTPNYIDVTISGTGRKTGSFATSANRNYRIMIYVDLTKSVTISNVQVEKSSQATSYSPYFTPIELCKIGTYEDKIFKNSGKNLANPSNINMQYGLNDSGAMYSGATTRVCVYKVPIKPSTTYSLFCESGYQIGNVFQYDSGGTYTSTVSSSYARTKQYTSSSTTYYISFVLKNDGNTTINVSEKDNLHIQIEKSSTATEYEPYGSGEWYVKKNIGKVVLDGTENWNNDGGTQGTDYRHNIYYASRMTIPTALGTNNTYLSNYFTPRNTGSDAGELGSFYMTNGWLVFVDKNKVYDLAQFKTWLGTNKPIVYYVLSTPTYEKLNDTLQNQLSNILLLEGLNNVTTSVPINLNYVSDMDTIDEEFFDENNVNFGEVYGPVNTIILSRSAESDEIAKSLVENEEDRIAIKISDNQILNFDGREEYLDGLLNRLSGTMYVQNDYTSKGICYYNIGDRYKAYIFGKYYRCLMLNDDVTIESGLSENVFTEIPETAQTDYSKTSTSDKTVRKANLIVDKQLGEITAEIETLDTSINGANGISSKLTSQAQTIDLWSKSFDDNGNVVALNTTNYTFDSEGLKIGKSTDDYNSLQDNTGTYYYEKDTMIGKYTKDGSVQKDLSLFGRYYYGIDEENFNVKEFSIEKANFVAQWYDDGTEEGFGHFWNGE